MRNGRLSKKAAFAASQNIKERDYWLDKLSGDLVKSRFPKSCERRDINKVNKSEPVIDTVTFKFSQEIAAKLMKLSNGSDYRLHIIMAAAVVILIYKYTAHKDIIIGSPIYRQDVDGQLINPVLALRNQVRSDLTFKEFLLQAAQVIFEANENQNYPLETLIYKLNLPVSADDFPLFDIAVLLDNIHDKNYLEHIKLSMVFSFLRGDEGIDGALEFNTVLYEKTFIKRLVGHFTHLAHQFVFDLDAPIFNLDVLSPEEKKQVIFDFNHNSADFPRDETICHIIEKHAQRTPDRAAVVFNHLVVSYGWLDETAGQLSRQLVEKGIGEDALVGILLDRNPLLVICILAAWKAGGAYIPIETADPVRRIAGIMNNAGAKILLTGSGHVEPTLEEFYKGLIIYLDIEDFSGNYPSTKSYREINMNRLAYVIYTSGSTGKPKGVMIEHIGMMNHIQAKINDLDITAKSIVAQNSSHTFDISLWQFFASLVGGGKTIIYPHQLIMEPNRLIDRIIKDQVTILELVPSYLSVMLDSMELEHLQTVSLPLEYLLVTGEEIKLTLVRKWFKTYPHIKMVNAYGPTEASDDITHYKMDKVPDRQPVPIGKSLQNFNIYIVDESEKLCPIGVKGEIWVSGVGVGRGYLHDEARTRQVFSEDPFVEKTGVRLYKTGDLGCWQPDGTIDFFGRKDYQVKIRGYRIELQEIESRLLNHEKIKEAVVLDKIDEQGNKYLCAYLVTIGELNTPGIKRYMLKDLPEYMIPAYFVKLLQLPLTPNGKIDRKALPDPSGDDQLELPYLTGEMINHLSIKTEKNTFKKDAMNIFMESLVGKVELAEEERKKILYSFNDTIAQYPKNVTVHQLFEEQVDRTPHRIAVVGIETGARNMGICHAFTYKELDQKADQLASLLKTKGITAESIVGLMMERSPEMIIGIVGILKAGGAYLPIDHQYPAKRIKLMLADSGAGIILTNSVENKNLLVDTSILALNPDFRENFAGDCSRPGVERTLTNMVHVLYTSGTTGTPKGIVIKHQSFVNFIEGMCQVIDYNQGDVILSLTSFSFDIFGAEAILPLTRGLRVVIGSEEEQLNSAAAASTMNKERITIFHATPSKLQLYLAEREFAASLRRLRYLLVAGEVFPGALLRKLQNTTEGRILNLYAPAESTVYSTAKDLTGDSTVIIGKPMANTRIYILGAASELQPIGAVGELCIGGDGLARGYLNKPELTREKFIEQATVTGETKTQRIHMSYIYRTGDLAKWLPDGNIEFLGRVDHQVQVKGIRIEPAEIEDCLLNYGLATIKDAVVVERNEPGSNQQCLLAYVVAEKRLVEPELREYVSTHLPLYMMPNHFIQLEKIPLTPNGKIDRRLLESLEVIRGEQGYEPPKDRVEEKLARIWQGILGGKKGKISMKTNFFDLGGDSLRAVILAAKIHQEFNVKVPLAHLFKTPTIRGLSGYINKAVPIRHASIEPVEKKEYYPLSSAQKRLYVLQQIEPDSTVYNIPLFIPLAGEVQIENLERIFLRLITKHESFRTSFHMSKEEPVQRIHPSVNPRIEFYEIGSKEQEAPGGDPLKGIAWDFIRPFDLSRVPVWRLGLVKAPRVILMVDMHHIITDGISNQILAADFQSLDSGQAPEPLRIQYKDFSQWQNKERHKDYIKNQEGYWLGQFAGDIPLLEIPTDYPRTGIQSFTGSKIRFEISTRLSQAVEMIARENETTVFVVFLAVYYILLSKLSGQEDIVIGTLVAGRRHADLERIIGMFVNTLALRNYPTGKKTFLKFLAELKERTLQAFENQDWQFEELVDKLEIDRDIGRNPLFDTAFAYQGIDAPAEEKNGKELYPQAAKQRKYEREISRFDISFYGMKDVERFLFMAEYSTKLFKKETIERFIGYFKQVISSVATANPKLSDVEIISGQEKKQILYDFNHTDLELPGDKALDVLFAEQAARVAGEIAVGNYLDLTPIYDELASETLNENMQEKLEKCRFEKNPYVFQFENNMVLTALNFFDEKEVKDLVLLRTHRENYIAVNKAVLLFLEYLDGQSDLKSVYNAIRDKNMECRVYPLVIDLDIGLVSKESKRFLLHNTFDRMVLLIKELYRAHLIELMGYGSASQPGSLSLGVGYAKKTVVMDSSGEEETVPVPKSPRYTVKGSVLLLGDRASTATTGLLYIASFLRRNGIEAYCQWNDLSKTTAQLKENVESLLAVVQPKLVGVSMKWFPHIARVLEICRIIKNYNPSIRVVVGGNTASYYKEQIIQYECIDYLIKGDGEVPFLKICLGDDDIPNCVYKKDGKIIETPITYIQDETNSSNIYLSHLDQIFVSKKDPYLVPYFYINTGKGCSMQCLYCGGCRDAQNQVFGRVKPFMRGVDEVRKDLIEAREYTSTFFFDFDLPAYDSLNYYRKIWEGIDFSQHFCEFYFWKLPTFELLDYIVKVFKYVYINIDLCSLSQPHRRKLSALGVVKPQPTDEELFDFFDQCEKYSNVEVFVNHIIGLPYFSYEDIEISRVTLEKLLTRYSCFKKMDWARLHAQPGAPIVETCEKYGMHSYAKTYTDFLYYSQLNLKEERYPELLTYYYPYIYALDEKLNSEISRFYAEAEKRVEANLKRRRRNLNLVRKISYEELDKKSNQLARVLREKGVIPGSITALCIERSPEMIIGLLAILKAGAAYLPLAPEFPPKRLVYMLKDSNAGTLLTQGHLNDTFRTIGFAGNIINIAEEELRTVDFKPLTTTNTPNSLAYVIYTSGSTGQPKGVLVEHGSVIRLVKNCNYIEFNKKDKLLLTGALVFDISTFEIWASLLNGVLLFLAHQNFILGAEKLREILVENNISLLHLIPQLFNQLADQHIDIFSGLRYLLVGGDLVQPQYINKVRNRYKELKILHMYGPTENTTFSTFLPVNKDYGATIPIGKPIANSTAFIINKNGQLQPIGIAGELWVGGNGVSRGYLNNPGLTAEKFLPAFYKSYNSYRSYISKDIYKTGDLAKWLPDGNIEFLGRIDQQVKVRGQRIELGEIETQLSKHDEIKAAVLLDKKDKDGEKYLCAYIVPHPKPDSSVSLSAPVLREYLSSRLPDYMIPSRFIFIEKVPLNTNGKIDRKALPEPEMISFSGYASPRNRLEKALVVIWSNVLGVEVGGISIDSDFFELGGHSLKATVLTSKLHQAFNVKIALTELFKIPTIRGLAEYIQGFSSCAEEMRFSSIEPVEEREYYPLSSAQKRLYVLQQMELESTRYNIPITMVLDGLTDKGKLEESFRKLIARHEILRTSVELINEEPWQRVHNQVKFKIEYHDAESSEQIAARKEEHQALCAEHCATVIEGFIRPFDLFQAPLLRGGLIKIGDTENILMIDIHHIVSDGTSMELLLKEFITLYSNQQLPSLRLRYRDYSEWQNSDGQKAAIKSQEEYWLKQFKGDIPVLHLPYDYPRPAVQSIAGSQLGFQLPDEQTQKLKDLALNTGTTLYMVLLAVFNILLSKISGQEDIVVGTPVAGRRHADMEKIIGMFVNTLVMRNYPEHAQTFRNFLEQIKERTLEAFENQEYQFEDLVEQVSVQRDTSRNPLFDVMFMVNNLETPIGNIWEVEISGLKVKPYERESSTTKFDLNLAAWETGPNLVFILQYCTKLFKKETIERFITYFKKIVSLITKETNRELRQIEIISKEEKQQVLYRFNNTQIEYPNDKTSHQLFEEQAEKNPTHLAVMEAGQRDPARNPEKTLTYRQLNRKSNQLARVLRRKGVRKDTIIGIMLDRSPEMIIGIMAVLKAGGAYLPMEPGSPANRRQLMLNDSKAGHILTTTPIAAKEEPNRELILLDEPGIYQGDHSNLESEIGVENLAYVIYTSGTTGNPKGVLILHYGLVNYIWWAARTYVNDESVNFPLYTSLSFDLTVTSIFTPLITGNTIVIYRGDRKENIIEKIIEENKVGIIKLTPSHLKLIRDKKISEFNFSTPGNGTHSRIKRLILGGEELETKLAIDIDTNFNGSIEIYNEYGPTETVVGSMIHQFNRQKDTKKTVLIGVPINNTRVYLVDKHRKPVPVGVVGEIYVAGNGVARGYLNNPELTSERFVNYQLQNTMPLSIKKTGAISITNPKLQITNKNVPGKRIYMSNKSHRSYIYRTGDLARWMPDGNIEFLGRIDHQVKIRGFRIEPGEIENQLLRQKRIEEAVVIERESLDGDKYLCAYIVCNRNGLPEQTSSISRELKEHLPGSLPDYMIPAHIMEIEAIPLSPSGKIDRNALPEPGITPGEEYVAPGNKVEEILVNIWAEVLNLPKDVIGIDGSFFDLGGHSIRATQMTAKINKELDVKIPLLEVFKTPYIRGLARYINESQPGKYEIINTAEKNEYYPLSSAQRGVYGQHQKERGRTAYNMPQAIILDFNVDMDRLEQTFNNLIQRHEILRTSFEMIKGEPVQRVHHHVEFEIEYHAAGDSISAQKMINDFPRPFELAKPPVLRVGIIKTRENENILVMDMHHIITDGLSAEIFKRDVIALYNGEPLPPLRIHYKDYIVWQNRREIMERTKVQREFWLKEFEGEIPVMNMPYDYQRPAQRSYEGRLIEFVIDEELCNKLKEMSRQTGATLYMILVAAYNILLYKYTWQEDIIVGSPVTGRRHADLENIIGMFVNIMVIRNRPQGGKTFTQFLREVKEKVVAVLENQDYHFEELVVELGCQGDASRNPLFDVVFSMAATYGESTGKEGADDSHQLKAIPYKFEFQITPFDLILGAAEMDGKIEMTFSYSTALFNRSTIEMMSEHFVELLNQIATNGEIKLRDIRISHHLITAPSAISDKDLEEFEF